MTLKTQMLPPTPKTQALAVDLIHFYFHPNPVDQMMMMTLLCIEANLTMFYTRLQEGMIWLAGFRRQETIL